MRQMKLSGGMTLIVVGAFCATTAGAERMEPLRILQEYTKTREATQRHIVESEELRENTDTAFGAVSRWERRRYSLMTDGDRVDLTAVTEDIVYDQDGAMHVRGNAVTRSAIWDGTTWSVYTSVGGGSASMSNHGRKKDHYVAGAYGGACLDGILPGDMRPVDTILKGADSISVREQLEPVNGIPCQVIVATTANGRYTLWIDPEHGYNISRAELTKKGNDLYLGEATEHVFKSLPAGVRPAMSANRPKTREEFSVVLDDVRFERIDGLWVPIEVRIQMATKFDGGKLTAVSRRHIKRTHIDLDPDFAAAKAFIRDFPDGTEVYIEEAPGILHRWKDGKPEPVRRY
ncbi:MAG: hypothetical protein RBS72_12400 [Sedimentisphaerales bacterium]|nr:hypothetical protein [Sedimentisphaerales bacterium]HNY78571.1 hypothetical protein [Sedimentisphaerales bacterium]HOC63771.1 hypothetical protein [Sedimentisphaerales bacterium]HQN34025.1 hypothetical protein [Sedimentisphaerales bacterium]